MLLIFLIILSALFIIRNLKIDILNPTLLYMCIWLSILFIYNLNIFRYFPKLSESFYIIFFTSILFFVVGSLLGKRITIVPYAGEYNFRRLFSVNCLLLGIVYASFVLTFILLGKPPTLGGTIDRSDYYIGPIEIFYFFIYLFWFIAFFLISNNYKVKENYILVLLSLIIILLKGNKFPFIFFVSIILYFLALKNTFKVKHILNTVLIIIVLFYFASFTYLKTSSTDVMYYKVTNTGSILPDRFWFLNDPLLYLTNNFMNLNNFLNISFEHLYGLNLFKGFLNISRLETVFSTKTESFASIWTSNLQYPWLTTGTYLKDVYSDFGYIGIILVPFMYGAVCGYMRNKIRVQQIKFSLLSLYIYHILFFSIILSFFTQYLSSNEIITNLIVFLFINKYVKKGGRQLE